MKILKGIFIVLKKTGFGICLKLGSSPSCASHQVDDTEQITVPYLDCGKNKGANVIRDVLGITYINT